MRVLSWIIFLAVAASARARIGEKSFQFADRYGSPKDTNVTAIVDKSSPLLEGAIHHHYEYQGGKSAPPSFEWTVRPSEWIIRRLEGQQ